MTYYGPQLTLDLNSSCSHPKGDEIVVMQQFCGGKNLMVFKGLVKPSGKSKSLLFYLAFKSLSSETFAFESRPHPHYPFALSLYINNSMDSRISVCCEYKYKNNVQLGCKHSSFGIYNIQKSKPCRT
jgi:hypothetical protein